MSFYSAKHRHVFGLSALALLAACSLKNESVGLKIVIQREGSSAASALISNANLFFPTNPGTFLATPSTMTDFSCFRIHVTGPGVFNQSPENCTSSNNFQGRGRGDLSFMGQAGTTFELAVPVGNDRRFDVYGVYPSNYIPSCGGTAPHLGYTKGYYLGGATAKISGPDQVITIPVSYAGASATLDCGSGQALPIQLVPTGSNEGKAYMPTGGNCSFDIATTGANLTLAPSLAGLVEISGAQYTSISSADASTAFTECFLSTPNTNGQVTTFTWDLSAIDLSKFSDARITWTGAAGNYSGACNATTTSLGAGAGSSPPAREFQYYKYNQGSSSTWVNSIGTQLTQTNQSFLMGTPENLVDTSGVLWVRILSDPANASSYCSTIQTDFIQLTLVP